jgi:replicative DNA helicase
MSLTDSFGHRLPPYSEEAERGVLGSILVDPLKMDEIQSLGVSTESFYVPSHRLLFTTLQEMYESGKVCDLLTVGQRLKDTGKLDQAGGYEFLEGLIDSTPITSHCTFYAEIVLEKQRIRNIISLTTEVIDKAYEDTTSEDLVSELSSSMISMTSSGKKDNAQEVYLEENRQIYLDIYNGKSQGVPFPFDIMTKKLGGAMKGSFIPLAGRGGAGKSTLLTYWETWLLERGYSTYDYCPEDGIRRRQRRIAAAKGQYNMTGLENRIHWDGEFWRPLTPKEFESMYAQYCSALDWLATVPVHMNESRMNVKQLCSDAKIHYRKRPFDIMFVDGLKDILRDGKQGDNQQDNEIALYLADLALTLDVPIVAIQHIIKIDPTALIEEIDLRGSGLMGDHARQKIIYQSAGTERYKNLPDTFEHGKDVVLSIPKNNYGLIGHAPIRPILNRASFQEITREK